MRGHDVRRNEGQQQTQPYPEREEGRKPESQRYLGPRHTDGAAAFGGEDAPRVSQQAVQKHRHGVQRSDEGAAPEAAARQANRGVVAVRQRRPNEVDAVRERVLDASLGHSPDPDAVANEARNEDDVLVADELEPRPSMRSEHLAPERAVVRPEPRARTG